MTLADSRLSGGVQGLVPPGYAGGFRFQHGGRGAYFLFGCNHHGHHRADFEIQDETSLPMAFNMFKGLALRLNGI